ncbi:lipoprotein signal peptidase [Neisseria shayeganii]|uniref:lipoprotein signal peptidase n=1 Tax=Neisseria shayeganii TaxID=607712 RepID=UPI001FD5EEAB|nr:lipoprotein signal peptidase [Neisseria shayeganii]
MPNPHLRRISALCAARSLAYLDDMSALAVLLRLELHPHLGVWQRSRPVSCPNTAFTAIVGAFGLPESHYYQES